MGNWDPSGGDSQANAKKASGDEEKDEPSSQKRPCPLNVHLLPSVILVQPLLFPSSLFLFINLFHFYTPTAQFCKGSCLSNFVYIHNSLLLHIIRKGPPGVLHLFSRLRQIMRAAIYQACIIC